MYLNPEHTTYSAIFSTVKFFVPVRHSTNLKPSSLAIDSIIFELTAEATIASFSDSLVRTLTVAGAHAIYLLVCLMTYKYPKLD
jgi:hypothetical protein